MNINPLKDLFNSLDKLIDRSDKTIYHFDDEKNKELCQRLKSLEEGIEQARREAQNKNIRLHSLTG